MLVLLICLPAVAGDDDVAENILKLYATGEIAKADQSLDDFLEAETDPANRCPVLLAAAQADRPFFDAKKRLRECIENCAQRPEEATARAALVRLLHLSGEDRTAINSADEFLRKHPDHPAAPDILLLRGALELRLPLGSTSGRSFATFLAKHPDHPRAAQALAGLGDMKVRQKDWPGAVEAYMRALQANSNILDLPSIYFHLGLAAEKQHRYDMAHHYYRLLVQNWPETLVAWRAKDRLESTLFRDGGPTEIRPPKSKARFSLSVGVYENLAAAERASGSFSAAGLRVHLVLRGKRCELLVGEFDTESDAENFANELTRRFHVETVAKRLP